MKKIFNELKVKNINVYAATLAAILGLSACGPKVDDVSATKDTEPSISTEVVVPTVEPTETIEPSMSEVIESSNVMEEPTETAEPVVEEFTCTAEDVISLVEDMSAKYTQIPKDELLSVIFALNFDELTDQDKDTIMNTYGVSYEKLDDGFYNYGLQFYNVLDMSYMNFSGSSFEFKDEDNYKFWPKHVDFIINPKKKEFADEYDDAFANNAKGPKKIIKEYQSIDGLSSMEISFYVLNYQSQIGSQRRLPSVFSMELEKQNVK